MEQIVAELIKEMEEIRRMKGMEGKIYKLEEENKEFEKRVEMLEEECFRKVGEKERMKENREMLKKMSLKERVIVRWRKENGRTGRSASLKR